MTTTAIGYIRVSTDEQHIGPQAQRAAIERFAAAQGITVVAYHEDHGVSGAAPIDKRPGLFSAINAVGEQGAAWLLVAKRDRLARDPIVAAMAERLVERAGARIVAADGAGNGDDPAAVLMRRMVDAFAEYERAMIRARTKAAMAVKKARGEYIGGTAPYGFDLVDGVLVRNEAEQEVIAAARELRASGMSLRAVGAALVKRGFYTRKGGAWLAEQVKLMTKEAA